MCQWTHTQTERKIGDEKWRSAWPSETANAYLQHPDYKDFAILVQTGLGRLQMDSRDPNWRRQGIESGGHSGTNESCQFLERACSDGEDN